MNYDLLPDLCDRYFSDTPLTDLASAHLALLPDIFKSFGHRHVFYGEVVTIKCFEDNSMVRELVATDGTGKVLVIDGGGSLRRSLLGDNLAEKAIAHGWQGFIINGCIRDVTAINDMAIGVKCLATNPIKTDKKGAGEINVAVDIASITILPGQYIYADANGVLISAQKLEVPNT